jgi:acyl carrier protein
LSTAIFPEAPSPDLQTQLPLEVEIATLIVDVLHLEIAPADIAPAAPLFRDGLGLDSIDALELALAISKRYGVSLRSDDDRNSEIFANLRSLARFIAAHRPA